MTSNPDVYPLTASFEDWWKGMDKRWYCGNNAATKALFERCRDCIGEYEHGSADVEDVFDPDFNGLVEAALERDSVAYSKTMLKAYVAVCTDIILTFHFDGKVRT